jgi:hypothetical protein
MAIKVGTEDKKKVIAVVVLMVVMIGLAIYQFAGGPSTPPPAPVKAPVAVRQVPAAIRPTGGVGGNAAGPEAKKLPGSGLDPSLHLEKLALSESIEYAGDGRNIFSADSAPMANVETALTGARPTGPQVPIDTGPPPPPSAPAIDLHYFGYSATRDGKREAFLSHGDDVFEAAAGEIVNHRYKVVAVDLHSIQITDLSYNNTQTLQLQPN